MRVRRMAATVVGVSIALSGCGAGQPTSQTDRPVSASTTASSEPSTSPTETTPSAATTSTKASSGDDGVLTAGEQFVLPDKALWVEASDLPYRFAAPESFTVLDMRAIAAGAPVEERLTSWAKNQRLDLKKYLAAYTKTSVRVHAVRTDGYEPAPLTFLNAYWSPAGRLPTRELVRKTFAQEKLPKPTFTAGTSPLGRHLTATFERTSGTKKKITRYGARVFVAAPGTGLAVIALTATSEKERSALLRLIARSVSYA